MKSKAGPQTNPVGMLNSNKNNNQRNSNSVVMQPAAIAQKRKNKPPSIKYSPNGSCSIKHREYLYDIYGTTDFAVTRTQINAGLQLSFPWLSAIANRFESYLFHSLKYEFCTESPTNEVGTVLLTVDFDPLDSAPVNKTQALAYAGAVRSPPWSDCCYQAARKDLHKRTSYFTRQTVSETADLTTKDVGNLYVCTQAQANNRVLGEIWVDYEVELMTPQIAELIIEFQSYNNLQSPLPLATNINLFALSVNTKGSYPPGKWDAGTFTFNRSARLLVVWNSRCNAGDIVASTMALNHVGVEFVDSSEPAAGQPDNNEGLYSSIIRVKAGDSIRPSLQVTGSNFSSPGVTLSTGVFMITLDEEFTSLV